ncbi:MAG: hypothetical protein DYG98_25970 [Haliscomenobacteraceae bacterium CHB4]|nr:hypothetical protein [Saprospiraceae bacterium]MCE7926509.1 hypothetical protein [Haliscomenobacteraceae bacterium CHB4]
MSDTFLAQDPLSGVDWNDLTETLEAQKCVLFLGSGAYEAPKGEKIEDALSDWLDASNPEHPFIRLVNTDGFYLLRRNRFKRKVIAQIKEFYNQPFPKTEELFAQLAEIPFSMIITLTPDNLLTRTFHKSGFDYQTDFYFRNRKGPDQFEPPTKNKPLIYNLLGNIEEPESIVLTQSDFFDYLESVFKANSMHADLKEELHNAERYIFLGLPYEKWYFQLLLRILSMHSDKLKEVERLALKEFENPRLHELYTEEFKIEFFPADVLSFVQELNSRCRQAGLLKKATLPDPKLTNLPDLGFTDFQKLVAEAQTEEAINYLKAFLDRRKPRSIRLTNDLVVLQNRYNLLRQREIRGTIYPQDLNIENSQITEHLLELITKAQSL